MKIVIDDDDDGTVIHVRIATVPAVHISPEAVLVAFEVFAETVYSHRHPMPDESPSMKVEFP